MRLPRSLSLLLLAYLALGLIYDQSTPTFEAFDEVWHYAVVREIADGRGLPIQRTDVQTTYRQEGSQPPLYYALAAALTFWIDDADYFERYIYNPFARAGIPGTPTNANLMRHSGAERFPWRGTTLAVHLVRYFSLTLGAGTVLLTYALALALFPRRADLALLAAGFTAFNPVFLHISVAVDNDSLVWFGSSLVLLITSALAATESPSFVPLRVLRGSTSAWLLGLLLALMALTKLSGLVLYPIVLLALLWRAFRTRRWREFLAALGIIVLCLFVISGWWFARNVILYDELLGSKMMARIIYNVQRTQHATWLDYLSEAQGWWYSLWGVFGAFSLLPGRWVFAVYTGLTLLAVAGGARAVWQTRGARGRRFADYAAHVLAAGFIFLTIVGVGYWTSFQYASQGRLALGAIAPMAVFLAAGIVEIRDWGLEISPWRRISPAIYNLQSAIIGILFALALLTPILYIAPRYRPPAPIAENDLPPDLTPVYATFGEEIELIGYTTNDDPIRPGESIDVTLYWRGKAAMTTDHNLALIALGRVSTPVGKLDTWPGGGTLPTGNWTSGAIYPDHYQLPVDASAAAPTLLRLDVSFWDATPSSRLQIADGNGASIPSVTLAVGRLIPAKAGRLAPQFPDGSILEGGVTLLGYDLANAAQPGSPLAVTLYWDTATEITGDYTVFVHLVDTAGTTVAQADSPPLSGDWPTSAWLPGLPVADVHTLGLPADLPPGQYRVEVGLYDPSSGLRLAAFRPDGEEWKDWSIRLGRSVEVY